MKEIKLKYKWTRQHMKQEKTYRWYCVLGYVTPAGEHIWKTNKYTRREGWWPILEPKWIGEDGKEKKYAYTPGPFINGIKTAKGAMYMIELYNENKDKKDALKICKEELTKLKVWKHWE